MYEFILKVEEIIEFGCSAVRCFYKSFFIINNMLGVNDYIQITVGILALIPASYLFFYYKKLKLSEYLFFGCGFLFGSINQLNGLLIRQGLIETTIIRTISNWLIICSMGFLFSSLKNDNWINPMTTFVICSSIIYTILLILFGLFPENELLSILYDEESSKEISSFPLIVQTFRIIVFLYGSYIYLVITPPVTTSRVMVYKYMMSLSSFLFSVYSFFTIPNLILDLGLSLVIPRIFNLLSLFIWAIIAIRIPETLILTLMPMVRGIDLFKKVMDLNEKEAKGVGLSSILKYIQSIPPEYLSTVDEKSSKK